jgi:hypothetical protein
MFNLSTQASAYFILICITTLINLICFFIMIGMWGFVSYLIYSLFTLPLVLLWMYNIDCLTTGNCQIWSWIITVLTLISVITTTVLLVAFTINPPSSFILQQNSMIIKPADITTKLVDITTKPTDITTKPADTTKKNQ